MVRKENSELLQDPTPHNKPILFIQCSHIPGPTCITPIPSGVLAQFIDGKLRLKVGMGLLKVM